MLAEIVAGLAVRAVRCVPRSASTSCSSSAASPESRTQAQALVMAGLVPGHSKPGEQVDEGSAARGRAARRRTSRAPGTSSRTRSTRSASTRPGSTASTSARRPAASPTCCCSAARARVIALDVGYGQLHPKLRDDPRVTVLERTNARYGDRAAVRAAARHLRRLVHLACGLALPPALALAAPGWQALVLVKPQFEAGRARRAARASSATPRCGGACCARSPRRRSAWSARLAGVVDSGLPGPKGNHEFVLHLVHAEHPELPAELDDWIADAAGLSAPRSSRTAARGTSAARSSACARVADDAGVELLFDEDEAAKHGGDVARRQRRRPRGRARRRRDDAARAARASSAPACR